MKTRHQPKLFGSKLGDKRCKCKVINEPQLLKLIVCYVHEQQYSNITTTETIAKQVSTYIIKISFDNVNVTSETLQIVVRLLCAEITSTKNMLYLPGDLMDI